MGNDAISHSADIARRRKSLFFVSFASVAMVLLAVSAGVGTVALVAPISDNLDEPYFTSAPSEPNSPLVTPDEFVCSVMVPREARLYASIREFDEGLTDERILGLDLVGSANIYSFAGSTPGLSYEFAEWLFLRGNQVSELSYSMLSAEDSNAYSAVFDFGIEDFHSFCPNYSEYTSTESLPSIGWVPQGFLALDGSGGAACFFNHVGPEISRDMGAQSAVITVFVANDFQLLEFDQVSVPLTEPSIGREFASSLGTLVVTGAEGFGVFEYIEIDPNVFPNDGDFEIGCTKQFVGDFDFPRVIQKAFVDSEVAEAAGLR